MGAIRPVDSHLPGAFQLVPLPNEIDEVREPSGPPAIGLVLRRYAAMTQARVMLQGERPLQIHSPKVSGIIVNASGPWRSEGDWWHRDREWMRSEWDVEIMKQGLFRLVECRGEWEVEGYYE